MADFEKPALPLKEDWLLGIRGRLLLLALGIAVPLVLLGILDLRSMWRLSRAQLNDSLQQQVELASVALERWLDDQKNALVTVAAIASDRDTSVPAIRENFEHLLRTRPFWTDLRITSASGTTIIAQPSRRDTLPPALADHLVSEIRQHNSWIIVTDRTEEETRPIVVLATPTTDGGAVIARIDGAAINDLFNRIELSQHAVISVLASDGRVLYRRTGAASATDADALWSPLPSALGAETRLVTERTSPIDGIKRVYGIARIGNTGLVISIGVPSATLYEPARDQLNRHALFGMLALLLAIGAALFIARTISVPIRRLNFTAQRLGAGELSARNPREQQGEIGDLALAFNTMADRIKEREERLNELDQLKSDFVSSVSHELRTPLTTIKLLAHLLQHSETSDENRREYARTIAAECERQIDFVGNLLDLSRIEAGADLLAREQVALDQIVRTAAEAEKHRAESLGLELKVVVDEELPPVLSDKEALRRVIRGLIDNAIKYTPEGGVVKVMAQREGANVAVMVADNGQGISAEDLPHVFDKFYRAGSSRGEARDLQTTKPGTAAPGVGLGLYLAQHVIENAGGRISVESNLGEGTTFRIVFPAVEKAQAESTEEKQDVEATVSN